MSSENLSQGARSDDLQIGFIAMKASIACQCGKVELEFTSSSPRVSTECCCNHCFDRVKYLQELGGPSIPLKPLLTSKWDNKVSILNGREHLGVYKLTPDTLVFNIASTCCHTFLLGRHAEYDTHCVTTSSDFPIWKNAGMPFVASSRWFSNQWSSKRLGRYPTLIGIWANPADNSITGDQGFEPILEHHMTCMMAEITEGAVGETFDEIVDSIGRGNITIASEATSP